MIFIRQILIQPNNCNHITNGSRHHMPICPKCGISYIDGVENCNCGSPLFDEEYIAKNTNLWKCPTCGRWRRASMKKCDVCYPDLKKREKDRRKRLRKRKWEETWNKIAIGCGLIWAVYFIGGLIVAFVPPLFETIVESIDEIIAFGIVVSLFYGGAYILNAIFEPLSSRESLHIEYPDDWNILRNKALIRDGYRCGNCGATENLHVHHIVPISKGGSNQLSNLRTLCEACHKKLHPHMK